MSGGGEIALDSECRLKYLGIAHIVGGSIVFVLDILCINFYGSVLQGIWAGLFMVGAGCVGLYTALRESRVLLLTTAILSIVAAILSAVAVILSFLLAARAGSEDSQGWIVLEVTLGVFFLAGIAAALAQAWTAFTTRKNRPGIL